MRLHPSLLLVLAVLFMAAGRLQAQTPPANGQPILSADDLQQLVAPIALYPDPLVALILQASTVPTDIVLANRYLNEGGDPNAIDQQSWDASVKGLARYPDVLKMMDENLDWTNQLGAAVLAQQDDVMKAIQAMRAKAQALGNLESTPQQQVIADQGSIEIVPANPEVIYVPVYDPTIIYVQAAPPIVFGPGWPVGVWLGCGIDWRGYGLYSSGYFRPGYGWGITIINVRNVWRPNPYRPRPRPPYVPGRPGGPGKPPSWRPPGNRPPGNRPPGGGNPNRPGIPERPGNRPGGPGNPGNRPGGPGNQPGTPGNRPNRPGNPGAGRPSIQPAPNPGRPNPNPGTRPPSAGRPPTTQPARPQRPAPSRPSTRPSGPTAQPFHPGNFDRQRPNTKQPEGRPSTRPSAGRPSAAPSQGPRSGGGGGGGRGGGGRGWWRAQSLESLPGT